MSPSPPDVRSDDPHVEQVRRFNRFYTRRLGVLDEGLLQSPFSLTESRLLWELAHGDGPTATDLSRSLALDAGYLSRLISRLKRQGLVISERHDDDARRQRLRLSADGQRAFTPLEARSRQQASDMLATLEPAVRPRLLAAFDTISQLLDDEAKPATAGLASALVLRAHRPGDIGWVIARHGALYAGEYHWDQRFEAMVARIAADFIDRFDPKREASWIAERDGQPIGCVFIVQARDDATAQPIRGVAQLRMLLVDPSARGLGLGERLVAECTRFAQQAGYRRIRLWTNSVLVAACRLYERAGYQLIDSQPYKNFGRSLVGQTWELTLPAGAKPGRARGR